jgi:hypothetical protein
MFDPSLMYPEGYHPIQINRNLNFKGRAKRYTRTQRPPRYYLIDFGLSRRYSSHNALDEPPPDKLHPTLSSWLKNINKLDSLINRLQELASSAPTDHRSQLLNKVAVLRATFKKQQERCIEFLQLSEDYANKYLLDIDAEIRQQSTLLDNLEERLEAAKKLHGDADDLQMLYESGTVVSMNDLRTTGKAVPRYLQRLPRGKLLRPSTFRYFAAASTGQCPVQ